MPFIRNKVRGRKQAASGMCGLLFYALSSHPGQASGFHLNLHH